MLSLRKLNKRVKYSNLIPTVSLDCLDHEFFRVELDKLQKLCRRVEDERFNVRNAEGTDYEAHVIEEIKERVAMMSDSNYNFELFDANARTLEV